MYSEAQIEENLKWIREAKRGSDTYGVLEKVAYYLHLSNAARSQDENWFEAQQKFARWQMFKGRWWSGCVIIKKDLTGYINNSAVRRYLERIHQGAPDDEKSKEDDWNFALNETARTILS